MKIMKDEVRFADWTPCFAWAPILIGDHWYWLTALEKKFDKDTKWGPAFLYRVPGQPDLVTKVQTYNGRMPPPPPVPRPPVGGSSGRKPGPGPTMALNANEALSTGPFGCAEADAMVVPARRPLVGEAAGRAAYDRRKLAGRYGYQEWKDLPQYVRDLWIDIAAHAVEAHQEEPRSVGDVKDAAMVRTLRNDRERLIRALRLLADPRPPMTGEEVEVALKQARTLIAEIEMRSAR